MSKTQGITSTVSVSLSASTSLSAAIRIRGQKLAAIVMPSSWVTANITFAAAASSSDTYYPVYDDLGNEVTVTSPAADRIIAIDSVAGSLAALDFIKIRSGTNATDVTQSTSAAKTFKLLLKG